MNGSPIKVSAKTTTYEGQESTYSMAVSIWCYYMDLDISWNCRYDWSRAV